MFLLVLALEGLTLQEKLSGVGKLGKLLSERPPQNTSVHPMLLAAATRSDILYTRPSFPAPNVEVLAWMHIPKTSGLFTFQAFVEPLAHWLNVTLYPQRELGRAKHDSFGENWSTGCDNEHWHCTAYELTTCLQRSLGTAPVAWMTVLRDPVERVLSEFDFYHKHSFFGGWSPSSYAKKDNLTEWVLDSENTALNKQALYMSPPAAES